MKSNSFNELQNYLTQSGWAEMKTKKPEKMLKQMLNKQKQQENETKTIFFPYEFLLFLDSSPLHSAISRHSIEFQDVFLHHTISYIYTHLLKIMNWHQIVGKMKMWRGKWGNYDSMDNTTTAITEKKKKIEWEFERKQTKEMLIFLSQ